jgi:CelD/BcsL family acetyltransferase involved in cellulose biosynthesis
MKLQLNNSFPEELETEWNELLAQSSSHVPFLRFEYLRIWWQTRGGGEWPESAQLAIITAREGERLVGIAPLFVAEWEGKPALLLIGSIEVSDYLDLIARKEDLPAFTDALLAFLSQPDNGLPAWQRLDLYNVLETSPTRAALQQAAQGHNMKYQDEPFRPAMTITLPGDWEIYLAGIDKKQRHEIRRKMRRAQTSEVPVSWYIARDPSTIDQDIEDFLHLMALDPDKEKFLTPAMRDNFRLTVRCAFDKECLCLSFLTIDGQKAAAYLSFDYLDQLWVYNSGMDFNHNEYSPGWVLLGELLKWANENGRKAFDFMRGDEDYKIRFGAKKYDVMRLTVIKKL